MEFKLNIHSAASVCSCVTIRHDNQGTPDDTVAFTSPVKTHFMFQRLHTTLMTWFRFMKHVEEWNMENVKLHVQTNEGHWEHAIGLLNTGSGLEYKLHVGSVPSTDVKAFAIHRELVPHWHMFANFYWPIVYMQRDSASTVPKLVLVDDIEIIKKYVKMNPNKGVFTRAFSSANFGIDQTSDCIDCSMPKNENYEGLQMLTFDKGYFKAFEQETECLLGGI